MFFFGSCDKTLSQIKNKLNKVYPTIIYKTLNPGYDNNVDLLSQNSYIDLINAFHPDILYVSLGAPKQEIWINQNAEKLNVGTIYGLGAAFFFEPIF